MDEYCNILGIENINRRWKTEFETLNPRAVELKESILASQRTIKDLREADRLAKQSIKGNNPAFINMMFTTNRITEEKRDELLNAYEACEASVAYNGQLIERQLALEADMKSELSQIVNAFRARKEASAPYKAKNVFLCIVAFVLGSISYIVGFFVVGIIYTLMNMFAVLPKAIDISGTTLIAVAFGANFCGYIVFNAIDKHKYHRVAFCVLLIVFATMYLTFCIVGGDWDMLSYPIISFIFNGIMIASCIKGEE